MLLRKAVAGTFLIFFAYVFWLAFIYVMQNDLFFYHPWLDIPFHLGGGFLIGLFYYNITLRTGADITSTAGAFFLLGLSLVIGVAWEVLELLFGLNKVFGTENVMVDTIMDLINDGIGAMLVSILVAVFNRPLTNRLGLEQRYQSTLAQSADSGNSS